MLHRSLITLSLPLLLSACMALAPVAWAAAPQGGQQNTILSGKVVSPVTRTAPLPFNAIIDDVLVSPGEEVRQGQALLRYHLQDETERLVQKEVTIGAGTEGSRSQMLTMERQLAEAVAQRNKAKQLADSKLGSNQALSRLEGDVQSIQQRISLLRQTINKQEASFKERLKELSGYFGTTLTEGGDLPRSLTLTSPMGGRVLSVAPGLYPGTLLGAGSSPIMVGQMDPMLVQVQVYEAERGRVKEGDTATVTIPSLQDKAFAAKVANIAWTSNDMNVSTPSYFTVELTVPNPDLELKPGFKAVVNFGKAPK